MFGFLMLCATAASLACGYVYMVGYTRVGLLKDLEPMPKGRHKREREPFGILQCRGPVYDILGKDMRCKICDGHYQADRNAKFWPFIWLKRPFTECLKAGEAAAKVPNGD